MRFHFDKFLNHHSNGDVNGLTLSSMFHLCYFLMAEEQSSSVSVPPLGLIHLLAKQTGIYLEDRCPPIVCHKSNINDKAKVKTILQKTMASEKVSFFTNHPLRFFHF